MKMRNISCGPRLGEYQRLFLTLVSLCAMTVGLRAQSAPQIASVYQGPSERPGYKEVVQLLDADQRVLWSIDLREGETFVEATADQALFRHSDGKLYRLSSPFTGGFEPVAEAPANPVDAGKALGLMLGLMSVLGGDGAAADSSSAVPPAPPPTPPPTPFPTPTPRTMIYTVVVSGNQLRCLDAQTSAVQGTFGPAGRIVSGPVVTGDLCTVVIEYPTGRKAMTYRLPHFGGVSSTDVQPSE